jgi:hypothetical protein
MTPIAIAILVLRQSLKQQIFAPPIVNFAKIMLLL